MTQYRQILRIHSQGISQRIIAQSCGCSRNTVAAILQRASAANLTWPLDVETDADLERLLFPEKQEQVSLRRMPDFEKVSKELSRSGVTLIKLLWMEYCEECRQLGEQSFMFGVYNRAHAKSLKKAKAKLKELTSRSQGRNVRKVMENVKVYIRGWLGYFGIASMKTTMQDWDKWLRRRFRMYIWKQWKKPRTRAASLIKLGVPKERAWIATRTRKGYWRCAAMPIVQEGLSKEILARAGYYSIQTRYEQMHLCD